MPATVQAVTPRYPTASSIPSTPSGITSGSEPGIPGVDIPEAGITVPDRAEPERAEPDSAEPEIKVSVIGSPGLANCCMSDTLLAGWCYISRYSEDREFLSSQRARHAA